MHLGRELGLINKHVRHKVSDVGESVIWYVYNTIQSGASQYDDVYDEGTPGSGGKTYMPGVKIPTIYAAEFEDSYRSIPDGIKLTQTIRLTFLLKDFLKAGIDTPGEYNEHINDMFKYEDRYYRVSDYSAKGRMKSNEALVAVQGFEVFLDEEMPYDLGPDSIFTQTMPWPTSFPS